MNVYTIRLGNNYDSCKVTAKSFGDAYKKAIKFLATTNKDREEADRESIDISAVEFDGEVKKL